MNERSALEKRIRRHVIGRIREYFAATAPGLEDLCRSELQSLPLTIHKSEVCPGGVVFHGRLVDCFMANLYLRTANRVLMRIDTFRATRFYELEKSVSKLPWELFLEAGQEIVFRIRAKKSKLYHTGAIADRIRSSIFDRLSATPQTRNGRAYPQQPQKIFVRVVNDRFTVSLDSSGANLHKRGIKTMGSKAPMRETTAAAVLMRAAYAPTEPLLDLMCGSGTFSVEAALMASHIPAGWFRNFAFTAWPAHRQANKRWKHVKADAEKRIAIPQAPLVLASDIDPRACNALKLAIAKHRFGAAIDIKPGDFFDQHPQNFTRRSGLVVINPPYGRRMATPEGPRMLLQRIGRKLISDFADWKFALMVPAKSMLRQFPLSVQLFPVFHGGLQVFAAIGWVSPMSERTLP